MSVAVVVILTAVLCLSEQAAAQQGRRDNEGPTTVAVALGAFSGGFDGHVRGSIAVDHYLGAFVAHVEGLIIPWKTSACYGGTPRGCGEWEYFRRVEVGGRLIDRAGKTHPYFGVGLPYLEVGVRQDLREKAGFEVRLLSEILGGGDGVIVGGASINVGFWHSFR